MSNIFSKIGDFFKHLFIKVRPGLEDFLRKYEQLAIEEVRKLSEVHGCAGLHEWRDEAFAALKAAVEKDLKDVADNWVSILLHLAYESIKVAA
jgi:hypothetical protein